MGFSGVFGASIGLSCESLCKHVWVNTDKITLSAPDSSVRGGGCFYDPSEVTAGQVFLNEMATSLVILLLAFGNGFDPRQALLFGPRLGPLLVGASVGVVAFAGSGMIPGYASGLNPARCFAFGIARQDMSGTPTVAISRMPGTVSLIYECSDQWIWWFGPAVAGVLQASLYNTVPPHHADSDSEGGEGSFGQPVGDSV